MQQYEFHEVANIFPMMTEEEFQDLIESIRKNGQREPIIIYQNKIIDGRNRYNACLELDIEPKVEQWDEQGSLLDFVRDENYNRRHMTPSQRSMVAARMKPLYEEEKEKIRLANLKKGTEVPTDSMETIGKIPMGRTNEVVGKMMGVSRESVDRASKVLNNGTPELITAVDTGEMSVRKAAEIAVLPKEVQKVAIEEAKISRKEVKKENEKYIEEHTYEITEEDKEIQEKLDEINDYLTKHMADLLKKICDSKTPMHVCSDVACFVGAVEKHISSLESMLQLKIKQVESEEND